MRRLLAQALKSAGDFPAAAPRPLRAALWFFLALAAAFLIFPDGWLYPQDVVSLNSVSLHYTSHGRPLFHMLSPVSRNSMPLLSVASLMAGNTTWPEVQALWALLSLLLCAAGYSLGCLLSGRPAGVAAAAALFAGQISPWLFFDIEQRFNCLMLALVANALALTLFSPAARRLIEGCAIGASFLARSLLCWLPAALAALELAAWKTSWKRSLAGAALILVVPFLFLVPWITFGPGDAAGLRIFDGRAEWNMVTGALGKVSTFEGDYRALAGITQGDNAALWVAKRIMTHPREYAAGVAKRTWFLLSPHALLVLFWLVPAVFLRRDPAFSRVNLLCAYLLAVNLAFSSEERYLTAILPLLAAAGAAGFLSLGAGGGDARGEGVLVFAGAAVLPAALVVFCMALLIRHPGAAPGHEKAAALERAVAAAPGISWLRWESGRLKLLAGDYSGAYRELGKAAVLAPHDIYIKTDLAAAALLKNRKKGRPSGGADLITRITPRETEWNKDVTGKNYILRALYALDAGKRPLAAASMRLALAERDKGIYFKRSGDASEEKSLKTRDTMLLDRTFPELLTYFPTELQNSLCPELVALYGREAGAARAGLCEGVLALSADFRRNYLGPAPGSGRGPDSAWALPQAAQPAPRAAAAAGGPDGRYPRALLDRCLALSSANKKEQALQACQSAVYAAAAHTGGEPAAMAELGSDASLESYRLFKALGRGEEAEETLFWAVQNAPASWPKLAEARKLLEGTKSR
ncbi:MAG TPA: hypothetical protein DCZ92_06445 [Elusimicrobia bacterium]|nr:MAG: hypothetical protein A2016_06460 [Elusimicrobia bacterium GWF2_62_30]HBA60446.1 hypothetical protein [Elusimicrobiota bacterium]